MNELKMPVREAEAAVAREIMGYKEGIKIKHTGVRLWTDGGASFRFHPSKNGDDLFMLLTRMNEQGWRYEITNGPAKLRIVFWHVNEGGENGQKHAVSYAWHGREPHFVRTAFTQDLICRTALYAVRQEVGRA